MNLSDNLKKIRKDNNLSQEQLAEKLKVSRQSVSKWESGAAFPELDKVMELCKLFNLNIDDLLNNDVKEVKETKESKYKINKCVDDVLNYTSGTFNMVFNMKLKSKIKFLLEQTIIVCVLVMIMAIIGSIGSGFIRPLVNILPNKLYYFIYGVAGNIFTFLALIVGIAIYCHILKTRYLDYYFKAINNYEETKDDNKEENITLENNNVELKKETKIIIRDPKHSEYKFMNLIVNIIVVILKMIAIFIELLLCMMFFAGIVTLVISIYLISYNAFFIGTSISLLGGLGIGSIFLALFYDFIFNKKYNAKLNLIILFIGIILGGVGVALSFISIKDIKFVDRDYEYNKVIEKEFDYNKDTQLVVEEGITKFIVNNDLKDKLIYQISYDENLDNIEIKSDDNLIYFNRLNFNDSFSDVLNKGLKDLKEGKVVNYYYSDVEIIVYMSEKNIKDYLLRSTSIVGADVQYRDGVYTVDYQDYLGTYDKKECELNDYYYTNCKYINYDGSGELDYKFDGDKIIVSDEYTCSRDYNYYYCFKNDEREY